MEETRHDREQGERDRNEAQSRPLPPLPAQPSGWDTFQRWATVVAAGGSMMIAAAAWYTVSSEEDDKLMDARFAEMAQRFETVNAELRSIHQKLDDMRVGMNERLLRLEDIHLSETRARASGVPAQEAASLASR